MKLLCERGMAKARITVNDEENYDATTINLTVKDDTVHGVRCGQLWETVNYRPKNHITKDVLAKQCGACLGLSEAEAREYVKRQGYDTIIVHYTGRCYPCVLSIQSLYLYVDKEADKVVRIMYNEMYCA